MLRRTTRGAGSGDHPFLLPSDTAVLEPLDAAADDALIGTGPSLPLGTAPRLPSPFRFGGEPCPSHLHIVGLHGGAGTTTVSRILGERLAVDADRSIPSSPAALLFVARTHGAGLDAALAAGQWWSAGVLAGSVVAGLVLVEDAPSIPRPLQLRLRAAARVLPRTWRLEWNDEWRAVGRPSLEKLPRRVRSLRNSATHEAVRALGQLKGNGPC